VRGAREHALLGPLANQFAALARLTVAQDGYLLFNSSSESASNEAEKSLDHCFLSSHSSEQENIL